MVYINLNIFKYKVNRKKPSNHLVILLFISFYALCFQNLQAQTVISENFESGTTWSTTGTTASTGTFVNINPNATTYQLEDAHGGTNALVTGQNSSLGNADIDGGVSIATSPTYNVALASELSIWYFFGQRDAGDDATGDFFKLEVSLDGGTNWSSLVDIGDITNTAAWTEVTTVIPANSNVQIRVQASDGSGAGDIVEAGIDDLVITSYPSLDTDGDSIVDVIDKDDDNDGILDTDEGVCSTVLFTDSTPTVSQSSTAFGGDATRAIDGNTNGVYGGGSVSHTANSTNPFWLLDLESTNNIDNITVYNRTDSCCEERLDDFILEVLDNNSNVVYTYTHSGTVNTSTLISNVSTSGNFVRISLLGTGRTLSIAEVQINIIDCPDLDNDGVPNSLDKDSDADGCFDVLEGSDGHDFSDIDADGELAGAVDNDPNSATYGVPLGNTQSVGTSQNNSTQAAICDPCNPLDPSFVDSDGDMIADFCDEDDDNDGVLDSEENCTGNANPTSGNGVNRDEIFIFDWSDAIFSNGIQDGESKTVSLPNGIEVIAVFSVDAANTTNADKIRPVDLAVYAPSKLNQLYNTTSTKDALQTGQSGDVSFTVNFTATTNGVSTPVNLLALDGESTNLASESISFQTNGDDWALLETDPSGPGTWSGEGTKTVTADETESGTSIFYSTNASQLGVNMNAGGIQAVAIGLWFDCIMDTDKDGIINSLDLDSDGDGCPDAIEAGVSFSNSDLQAANVTNGNGIDASANTSTSINNAQLNPNGTDDNDDGLNDSVDSAQDGETDYTSIYTTKALDNIANACIIDVSLTKTVNKVVPKLGDEIIFTIVVKNNTDIDISAVEVKDKLPVGLTYVQANSVIPANTTYDAGTGIWDLSSLTIAPNQTQELKIAATVNTTGAIIMNKAEISSLPTTDKDSTPNNDN